MPREFDSSTGTLRLGFLPDGAELATWVASSLLLRARGGLQSLPNETCPWPWLVLPCPLSLSGIFMVVTVFLPTVPYTVWHQDPMGRLYITRRSRLLGWML